MTRRTHRTRVLASAAVATGLCLSAAAVVAAPPSSAVPGVCDTPAKISALKANDPVHGLTVSQGTTPAPFTGSVIGVLTDGIEPGVDMVMVKLTSPAIDQAGIWEGMSGSPVYAANGDLIGAVAYTLSWGATPVAGVTPWADMDQYAGSPSAAPTHVAVSAGAARSIARQTTVTANQAAQGFHELPTPKLVSGLGPRALAKDTGRPYLPKNVAVAGTTSSATSPTAADMVAGGNLVATESTGDVVFGGLGTITSVCNNRVVGFGHPMEFTGKATYGMAGADALYIQTDPVDPSFKVANLGGLLGTIDQDRMTGISGDLGPIPPSLPITSKITYTPSSGPVHKRTGSSQVQLPIAAAAVTNYEMILNEQAVLDAYQGGTEAQSWTITGHTDAGPFTITAGNRYTDTQDVTFASVWDLPDLVWLLSHVDGVTLDSVNVHSRINDNTSVLKIAGLQQKRAGAWQTIGAGHPLALRAGGTATLRVVYAGSPATTGRAFRLAVPAKAAGGRGDLAVSSAEGFPFERGEPKTLAGVTKLVTTMVRNDQAQVSLFGDGKGGSVRVRTTTPAGHQVIVGQKLFRVRFK
jgi:hypothetical protein